MDDKQFEELHESVKQGAAIMRGEARPSRVFRAERGEIRQLSEAEVDSMVHNARESQAGKAAVQRAAAPPTDPYARLCAEVRTYRECKETLAQLEPEFRRQAAARLGLPEEEPTDPGELAQRQTAIEEALLESDSWVMLHVGLIGAPVMIGNLVADLIATGHKRWRYTLSSRFCSQFPEWENMTRPGPVYQHGLRTHEATQRELADWLCTVDLPTSEVLLA